MTDFSLLNQYVGVPFISRGRTPIGWDCWGAVRWAYKDLYQFDLPEFLSGYSDATKDVSGVDSVVCGAVLNYWPVPVGTVGAVHCYYTVKRGWHVGLVIPGGKVFHCDAIAGTEIVPEARICMRIKGAYSATSD